jgi:uncharacterized protein
MLHAQYAELPNFVVIEVQDQSGAAVPGVEVHVVPVNHGDSGSLRTNRRGLTYLDVVPGTYELTVDARGFVTQKQIVDVTGQAGQSVRFKLKADPLALSDYGPVILDQPAVDLIPSQPLPDEIDISIEPTRPIPSGQAPNMQVKLLKSSKDEKVYVVVFHNGDEALSGLTDFAIQNHIVDAHFTAIGAISGAILGWLDLPNKQYRAIPVDEQVEVLSMIGDIATYNGKPVVHTHVVLGRPDGSTVGGDVWELHVNPTLEVFVTANTTPLKKKPDDASGMKFIDPTQ